MKKVWALLLEIPKPIQWLLVAAVVFGLTITIYGAKQKDEMAAYIEQYKTFQSETKLTLKVLDSVKAVVAAKDVEVVEYMKDANALRNKNDQLLHTLPSPTVVSGLKHQIDSLKKATTDSVLLARTVIPKQDTLIKAQDSTIVVYKASLLAKESETLVLRETVGVQSQQIVTLRFLVDTATHNILNIPKPPANPNKFLGIFPKPTRMQSMVGGFVGGILAATYLLHY